MFPCIFLKPPRVIYSNLVNNLLFQGLVLPTLFKYLVYQRPGSKTGLWSLCTSIKIFNSSYAYLILLQANFEIIYKHNYFENYVG